MNILRNLVAGAVAEIRGAFSRKPKASSVRSARAAEMDGITEFAPVTGSGAGAGARRDATGDAVLALRSSNEEPRPGDGGTLPGTALPGPGTQSSRSGQRATPEADVFIEARSVQGMLGDVDWDVLSGGDAVVRILGDDGHLHAPGDRRS